MSPTTFGVGDRVDITCSVSPVNSAFTYSWTKDGNPLSSVSDSIITFTAIGNADYGVYTCTVIHGSLTSAVIDAVTFNAESKLHLHFFLILIIYTLNSRC